MDDTVKKSITFLGLNTDEIKIFMASFRLGPTTIPELAKHVHFKRSTTYLLIQGLIKKGLLIQDHKNYARKIQTIDPHDLLRLISGQRRRLRRQEIDLEQALPQLTSLYQSASIQPKVRLYEGNSGLLSIWHDILSTKNEILLWTNQQTENKFFDLPQHNKFIEERLSKHIPIRVLATNSPEALTLKKFDNDCLRQTKLLPSDTTFTAETYIYDHKVAQLDYNKDIIGIITESIPLSDFQRTIFNFTWNSIK